MLAYRVTSPHYPRVQLRLCCQLLKSMEDSGLWKCTLQVVEHGHPVLDSISIDWRDREELAQWIAECREEGWTLAPDNLAARQADGRTRNVPTIAERRARQREANERFRARWPGRVAA